MSIITRRAFYAQTDLRLFAFAHLQTRPLVVHAHLPPISASVGAGYWLLRLRYEDAFGDGEATFTARLAAFVHYPKDRPAVEGGESGVRFKRFVRGETPDQALVCAAPEGLTAFMDWMNTDGKPRSGASCDWWAFHTQAVAEHDAEDYQRLVGAVVGRVRVRQETDGLRVEVEALQPLVEHVERALGTLTNAAPAQQPAPTEQPPARRRGRKPVDAYARLAELKRADPGRYEREREALVERLARQAVEGGLDAATARRRAVDAVRSGVWRAEQKSKG
ncbi:MAG: hypothetical protein NZ693_09855 [Thermoflexales bacterium]|nr:hypothetical protein [Thermoflexales bacterium]